jgi:hypothetical protein
MPLVRLFLNPGIDKQNTEYGAEGGWIDADYVRFRYGLPEKIGGWVPFGGELESPYLLGLTTEIITWNSLDGTPYLLIGTTRKLYVYTGGLWADVTPIRDTGTVTFDTVSGSTTVVVNAIGHGCVQGDFVTFENTTGDPGGILDSVLDNEFEIQSIVGVDAFSIVVPTAATSTVLAAGSADAVYQLNVGTEVSYFEFGWGLGTWGFGSWGTPRPRTAPATYLRSRVWQFDTYGEDIVCQLVDGPAYYFDTSAPFGTRATLLTGAPTRNTFALVSTPDRHLVCFGTETIIGDPASQDPMFVRFSNQEDITSFVESATNTAGGQRLTDGSRIVSAVRSRGQILIFTDTSLHGMQYLGPPYTFGFQQLGANCGCIGSHAAVDVDGMAFWMGPEAFYMFDGTVKKMPCTVQDYVFKDINLVQGPTIQAGVNSQFNEVTWWYCSFTSDYIDRWVSYNYLENVWSVGTMPRTAWEDKGTFEKPLGAEFLRTSNAPTLGTIYGVTAGRTRIYDQESGVNGNGFPIFAYIQSGYFDIADGENMLFMSRFIPDFKNQQGNLTVRLLLRPYPQAAASPSSLDPYVITPTTQKVDTRARGRQISLKIESADFNTNWRFGTMRVNVQPDGLR